MKKPKINKAALTDYAGMILGGVAASKVSSIKLPIALPAPVQALLPAVLGVLLAGRKGFLGSLGKGMIVVGGMKAIGTLAPQLGISNYGMNMIDDNGVGAYEIEGADYALAGNDDNMAPMNGSSSYSLAGIDADDNSAFG
jgi:hypothetical protein